MRTILFLLCSALSAQNLTLYNHINVAPLTGNLSNVATTLPVTDPTLFDAGQEYVIGEANEVITVTGTNGSVTISRGAGAVAYSTGAMVKRRELVRDAGGSVGLRGSMQVLPSGCHWEASGNTTGTQGPTTRGGVPVVQIQTSATGTNTHTYRCPIPLLSTLAPDRRIVITSVDFTYGSTVNLAAGSASLVNGTINGTTVFTSEQGSLGSESSAPARADRGTLGLSSVNTSATANGRWRTLRVTPAVPIPVKASDALTLNITLQCAATTATVSYTRGFKVNYEMQ